MQPASSSNTNELTPEQFMALRDRLARFSGVYLDDTRLVVLQASLARRLAATGLSLASYMVLLFGPSGDQEAYQLAELLLNHETVFFRNQPQFRALRELVLPELHRRLSPGVPLRLWSAGCATGEEPYSLAITALEALGTPLPRPVEIIASDLSLPALSKARAGTYRGRTLMNIEPRLATRYFERRGELLVVRPEVRNLVSFTQHNLLEAFPPQVQGVHAIFCQNVTIYFQLETCRALMGRFHGALADDGYLFLGFSETLWNIYDGLRSQELLGAFVYRKPLPTALNPRLATRKLGSVTSELRPPSRPPTAPLRPPPAPASSEQRARPADPCREARALLDAGKVDAALDLLRHTPLVGSTAPTVLALMARANANRGELDLAAAQARRALELDSLTTEAYILLGMIYAQQGQLSAAVTQLERARYLDSAAPLISYHLAELYRQLGNAQAAVREYRNALRKLAEHPPDHLLDGVAVRWLRETCQRHIDRQHVERR
jgi:chemotaxis protein methyltransferase CheR